MPDAHQRFEDRLHAMARKMFLAGVYHVPFASLFALGKGNPEIGEQVLHKLFEGHMAGPRAVGRHGGEPAQSLWP
jgi:hypothetical protein